MPHAILLAVAFLLLRPAGARAEAPRIVHTPPLPAVSGTGVDLVFTVIGGGKPAAADVSIRASGDTAYTRFAADERKGIYRAAVPSAMMTAPGFEYFLLVRMESGEEISSPARDPSRSPYRIPVLSAEAVARILILSPERDAIVGDSVGLSIGVLFDPPLLPGDSCGLSLDGMEVAEGIERTADYLLYKPVLALARGPHEASAFVVSASGERGERRWRFSVGEGGEGLAALRLSGKAEAGWAFVRSAGIEGEPVLSYDETSSLAYDAYASGEWRGRSVYLSSSRDPIYDDEIRATGRLGGEALTVEIGDVYPSFSELSVSWLAGKGAEATVRRGPVESSLFFVRSLPSDTAGGLGTYSQFISGEKLSFTRDRWDLALQAAYGWERESSVPDTLRFLPPVKNLVLAGSAGLRLAAEQRLDLETGWSDSKGDDTTSAAAFRVFFTLLDSPQRSLRVEYHDYRTGYAALASPTVDGGEHGSVVDGSFRAGGLFRQSLRAEVYRDRESIQEIDENGWIVQLYGRTDFEWKGRGLDWNPYLLFRAHEIPYASDPYASRYGTVGVYARGAARTLSLSATRTDTRSSSRTLGWTGSGSLSGGGAPGARLWWRIGERYASSATEGDTAGSGIETTLAEEKRWTLDAEIGVRAAGIEWRADYQRIDESDAAEDERFTQHLLLVVAGRKF